MAISQDLEGCLLCVSLSLCCEGSDVKMYNDDGIEIVVAEVPKQFAKTNGRVDYF